MPGKKRSGPPKPSDTTPVTTCAQVSHKKDDKSADDAKLTPRQGTDESSSKPVSGHSGATAIFTTPTRSAPTPSKSHSSHSSKGHSSSKKGHSTSSGETRSKLTPSTPINPHSSGLHKQTVTPDMHKKDQRHSGSEHSDSTASSDAHVQSGKVSQIVVAHRVTRDDLTVSFYINVNQRPGTLLQGQGDHATSYIAIIQALLSTTNLISVGYAIKKIKRFGINIISREEQRYLEKFKATLVHDHDERINARDALQSHVNEQREPKISSTLPDRVSKSMKYSKISAKANDLCDLATYILNAAQKQDLATFYSNGRTNKKINEGVLAKNAARALLVLDKLCYIGNLDDPDKMKKEIGKLKEGLKVKGAGATEDEHIYRYGISVLNGLGKEGLAAADKLLKELSASDHPQDVVREEIKKYLLQTDEIGEYMGDLLDYHRKLEFTVTKANRAFNIDLGADSEKVFADKAKEIYMKVDHRVKVNSSGLKKTTPEIKIIITRTAHRALVNVINHHLKVLSAAYPALSGELRKSRKAVGVYTHFLSCKVLKEQGWGEHVLAQKENKSAKEAVTSEYLMRESQTIQSLITFPANETQSSPTKSPSHTRMKKK